MVWNYKNENITGFTDFLKFGIRSLDRFCLYGQSSYD